MLCKSIRSIKWLQATTTLPISLPGILDDVLDISK
jgi:hypothetical protein